MVLYWLERSLTDRRESDELREAFDLDYLKDRNRKKWNLVERRSSGERRSDWVRVSEWSSVYIAKK